MLTLLDTPSIIGIIITIALISANIAIILYIYQKKGRDGSEEDEQ